MKKTKLYLMYINELDLCKIGVSIKPTSRNEQLQTGCPYKIEIKHIFESAYPYKIETALHNEFKPYKQDVNEIKLKGEWFKLNQSQIDSFISRCEFVENNINFLIESGNSFI